MKKALITGITGQDGSYLAEFLLKKGYKIFGTIRRNSTPNLQNIEHIKVPNYGLVPFLVILGASAILIMMQPDMGTLITKGK